MIKIVTAQEMGRIEKLAYADGASEQAFMEAAGAAVAGAAQRFIARRKLQPHIVLLCGSGNNAGDAYVAGRLLLAQGFAVRAFALAPAEKSSHLCKLMSEKFQQAGGHIEYLNDATALSFGQAQLLLDGLLGTGFHGEVQGLLREVIEKANSSGLPILAIDIPSGINGTTGEIGKPAIKAHKTLFLGLPKWGCFSQEVWGYVGKVGIYDFGLAASYIEKAEEVCNLIDDAWVSANIPPIVRTRNKYQAGYVVGVGGSPGMPGAPIMASFATLRAGAGIVRLLHPAGMEAELAAAPFEVIRQGYEPGDLKPILEAMQKASALFVGPGLSTSKEALNLLQSLLPKINKPCVIDADALTLIAQKDIPLPSKTILTPHQGEMKRLLHITQDLPFAELFKKCQEYTDKNKVTLVLKGAPTFIFHPQTKPHVCAHGDPGMATAGSGDVLTGIIAGFLAQTGDPLRAALLGVQFHSLAGEHAARTQTSASMTATDITAALPQVFRYYRKVTSANTSSQSG